VLFAFSTLNEFDECYTGIDNAVNCIAGIGFFGGQSTKIFSLWLRVRPFNVSYERRRHPSHEGISLTE
jgi:hypothetical protein